MLLFYQSYLKIYYFKSYLFVEFTAVLTEIQGLLFYFLTLVPNLLFSYDHLILSLPYLYDQIARQIKGFYYLIPFKGWHIFI